MQGRHLEWLTVLRRLSNQAVLQLQQRICCGHSACRLSSRVVVVYVEIAEVVVVKMCVVAVQVMKVVQF